MEWDKVTFMLSVIQRHDNYIMALNRKVALIFAVAIAIMATIFSILDKVLGSEIDYKEVVFFLVIIILSLIILVIYNLYRSIKSNVISSLGFDSVILYSDLAKKEDKCDFIDKMTYDKVIQDLSYQSINLSKVLKVKLEYLDKALDLLMILILPYILMLLLPYFSVINHS